MARIRTVKPEFWTSAQVMDLSRDARLAFIGLWNFCDDAGIHPASPKRLKAEVFPADDLSADSVAELIREMISSGLVAEYSVDGEAFWIVTGWHHQKIDQPTYKFPRPDGMIPAGAPKRRSRIVPLDSSVNGPRTSVEHSSNVRGVFTPGKEGKGEEKTKIPNTHSADSNAAGGSISVIREFGQRDVSANSTAIDGASPEALTRALRDRGVQCTPAHPDLAALVEQGVTKEVVIAGAEQARLNKPDGPIPLRYVIRILEGWARQNAPNVAGAAVPQRAPGQWWLSGETALAKAHEVGVGHALAGESEKAWHARIRAAIEYGGTPSAPAAVTPTPTVLPAVEGPKAEMSHEQLTVHRAALKAALKKPAAAVH
ncbi:hypothetical protein [Caballeronia sp. LZ032]|uniref:hypothetical protein n=1 Tax=Caballeronia sp. LZ032 TaxID=3038565 RepID=UPI002854C27A|nr:hypothetical protein [Caballeronia sp. LZ032]MDR5878807.1 hypothetical protein [Caballeronia sp. LZ032]